jgi:DNA-binding NarL/FixJ family response regulator
MTAVQDKFMTGTPPLRRRVLLLDDDEVIAVSLRQYLMMQNCEVDIAVDLASGREQLTRGNYDVVVMDPYLTGAVHNHASLVSEIRAAAPQPHLIVLTAYVSPALLSTAATCPPATVLAKPQSVVFLSTFIAERFPQAKLLPQTNPIRETSA